MTSPLARRLLGPRPPLLRHREEIGGVWTAWVEVPPLEDLGTAPLVLVPGLSMSWRAYRWVLELFPRDRRLLVVDPPGAGRSDRLRGTMDAEAQAGQISAWLDHLDLSGVDLVGHSSGALTGARLAAARPDLVTSLVLVSPSPDVRWSHLREHVGALAVGVKDEAPRVLLQAVTDYVRSDPRVLLGFRSDMGTTAKDVMAGVQADVLVLRGADDLVSSGEWCDALADAGGGRHETVLEGGHGLPQQHPAALVAILRTFTGTSAADRS